MLTRHFATILFNALDFLTRTIPVQEHVLLITSLTVMHHNADHVVSSKKMIANLTVLAIFSMGLSSPIQQEISVSRVLVDTIQHVPTAARQNV
jgi:hypothetical protein